MSAQVVRLKDYERRSREPDAIDRDPTESAVIIIIPLIRIERYRDIVEIFGQTTFLPMR